MITGPVLLMGHDRFGHVRKCWEYFQYYGFREAFALINSKALFLATLPQPKGLELVEVQDLFDAEQIASTIAGLVSAPSEHPFICAQDNLAISYLAALDRLGYKQPEVWRPDMESPWVPVDAIRRCRLKPCARLKLNAEMVDPTRWALLKWNGGGYDWLPLGGLSEDTGSECIVKPVAGEASQMVKRVVGSQSAIRQAAEIQAYYQGTEYYKVDTAIECDGIVLDPGADALVEELLEGPEFTVDGFVIDGAVRCVVQHKEARFKGHFIGDGLTVSPPDWTATRRKGQVVGSLLEPSPPIGASEGEFQTLMARGIAAVGLSNWPFHAEVIETRDGLRFVEINPRPAGGLLALTATYHLGTDVIEIMIRSNLGIPTPCAAGREVVAEFPIYATQAGVISEVCGLEEARQLAGVVRIDQIKRPGDVIRNAQEENVIAVVLLRAATHDQVRELEWQVRRAVKVHYHTE